MGFKYNPGDTLGKDKILFLERTKKDKTNTWFGIFECPFCKSHFETRISDITSGHTRSCGCLATKTKSQNGKKNLKDLTGQKYGKLTALEPTELRKDRHVVWKCQCECGNITFIDSGDWGHTYSCGCTLSKVEAKIQKILQENDILFEKQKTFSSLVINNTTLRFDFFLPLYNCLIEYDGIQHFKFGESMGWNDEQKFIECKKRDQLKNNWCKENNFILIRIPYTDFNLIDFQYLKHLLLKEGGIIL